MSAAQLSQGVAQLRTVTTTVRLSSVRNVAQHSYISPKNPVSRFPSTLSTSLDCKQLGKRPCVRSYKRFLLPKQGLEKVLRRCTEHLLIKLAALVPVINIFLQFSPCFVHRVDAKPSEFRGRTPEPGGGGGGVYILSKKKKTKKKKKARKKINKKKK